MKRVVTSSSIVFGVPAVVLFALTANPARLYAESAPAPVSCQELSVTACADAAPTSACSYDGGAGFCQSALCTDDAGVINTFQCRPFVSNCQSPGQLADCVGKDAGNPCGNVGQGGFCGLVNCPVIDGGTDPTLSCLYTGGEMQPEAGPKDDGGGDASQGDAAKADSAPGTDSGTGTLPPASGDDDEGCSCATAGGPTTGVGGVFGFLVAMAFMLRRRRK